MRSLSLGVASLLAFTTAHGGQFEPPGQKTRTEAIGPTQGLPPQTRRVFSPSLFEPISRPGPSDWLTAHRESGQTYSEFMRARRNRPDKARHTIYLQPVGKFTEGRGPSLDRLKQYAEAFFGMRITVAEPLTVDGAKLTTRINDTRARSRS